MTVRFKGPSRVLRTLDVGIRNNQAFGDGDAAPRRYGAIWDTGATHTAVTRKAVEECKLTPTGIAQLTGVHGTSPFKVHVTRTSEAPPQTNKHVG